MKKEECKYRAIIIKFYTIAATIIIGLILVSTELQAEVYKGSSNRRVNVDISQMGVNRMEIRKDRIAKVIGNQDEYAIEGDSKTGAIFLSVKGMAGEVVPITVITEKGYMQDINMHVKKVNEPKTVIIDKPASKEIKPVKVESQNIKEQVIEAIKDISGGSDRNFTKREISEKEIANYQKEQSLNHNINNLIFQNYQALVDEQIEVIRVTEYSNRFLRIIKYEYQSKPCDMGLKQISELFKGAVSISERGNVIFVVYRV